MSGNGAKASSVGADGTHLFSRAQAASFLGTTWGAVRYAQQAGRLRSILVDGVHLFSRDVLERYRDVDPGLLAARAFRLFKEGMPPEDVVIELEAAPEAIVELYRSYSRLTGTCIVEGPKGSRAAWMKTYNVRELSPDVIRRALELCHARPELRERLYAV